MLDLAILGLLVESDLHGYELRKRLGDLRGLRLAISFGSLYPALGRLERAGYVKAVTSAARTPSAPMSGSLVGELAAFRAQRRAAAGGRGARGKKVYGITDAGRQRLVELLTDPDVSDDREFPVRVAFCEVLPPEERLALFERRRAELVRRVEERRRTPGDRGVNTYLRSLFERDTAALEADIAWLDRLIENERAAAAGSAAATPPAAPDTTTGPHRSADPDGRHEPEEP
ncbi:MAG TPA: PadR family transcriptional regulator [Acidimicrobiales bacterium]|jgi:DNA-binding PadR family transcriptional regulator|nr:PadR family transcriptional regulator [Acidimicrobiales bacterium]